MPDTEVEVNDLDDDEVQRQKEKIEREPGA